MRVSRPKVLLITASNLGPYHQARYSELSQGAIDLVVVKTPQPEFFRPWSQDATQDGFRSISPFGNSSAILKSPNQLLRCAQRLLRSEKPDVVVCIGYNNRCTWAISFFCRVYKIPCLLYIVGWEGERARSKRKEVAKKLFCSYAFSAAMATGSRASDYAQILGISKRRIWQVGNVVDNSHFAQPSAVTDSSLAADELPRDFFFTVVRLSAEKNVEGLLSAFVKYRQTGGTWDLCIAGTGPLETDLKQLTPPTLKEHIHWLGWVSYKALPLLYQKANCFVISSFIEPWGLVVNEAMAAGLPVLISDHCGCQPELCLQDRNGFGFEPSNAEELAQLMSKMSEMPIEERITMSEESRRIVANFTLETWRQAFVDCVTAVANGHDNKCGKTQGEIGLVT
jgi:glycosyltransferase involved in cell wall biosynthesis